MRHRPESNMILISKPILDVGMGATWCSILNPDSLNILAPAEASHQRTRLSFFFTHFPFTIREMARNDMQRI
jgi:hypothetical protein